MNTAQARAILAVNGISNYAELRITGIPTYDEARKVMRKLGFHKVEKGMSPNTAACWLIGMLEDKTRVICFAHSLPPSCQLVKTIKRVPRIETREVEGFIEIEETKVVCDGKDYETNPVPN